MEFATFYPVDTLRCPWLCYFWLTRHFARISRRRRPPKLRPRVLLPRPNRQAAAPARRRAPVPRPHRTVRQLRRTAPPPLPVIRPLRRATPPRPLAAERPRLPAAERPRLQAAENPRPLPAAERRSVQVAERPWPRKAAPRSRPRVAARLPSGRMVTSPRCTTPNAAWTFTTTLAETGA